MASFPISGDQLVHKGQRWHLALQQQIAIAWNATVDSGTVLTRENGFIPAFDTFAIAVTFATVAVRVIDLEVFRETHGKDYFDHRNGDEVGRVVSGLVAPRNFEVHGSGVIDPNIDKITGTNDAFRIYPSWKSEADLIASGVAFENTGAIDKANYRDVVAGQLVIDTLLDAVAFFSGCDPNLAARDDDGELAGFPLPALVNPFGYDRRHPDWPRQDQAQLDVRSEAVSEHPGGSDRHIAYRLVDDSGATVALAGMTTVLGGGHSFTETPEQIVADVTSGFPYYWNERLLSVTDNRLVADGDVIDIETFPLPPDGDDTWATWFRWNQRDAFLYRRQRRCC